MTDVIGRIRPAPPSLRYVILRHEGIDDPHFDLMFETSPGSQLATWRSPRWPIETETQLVRLGDHRRDYLSYEGPVSGNRGHVRRVACGFYRLDRRDDSVWQVTFRDYLGFRRLRFAAGSETWTAHPAGE